VILEDLAEVSNERDAMLGTLGCTDQEDSRAGYWKRGVKLPRSDKPQLWEHDAVFIIHVNTTRDPHYWGLLSLKSTINC
jgi:hypothetical protein